MPNNYVIIVAGGTGTRMRSNMPKQFLILKKKPVIAHAIQKFLEFDKRIKIIIAVHKDYYSHLQKLILKYFPENAIEIVIGGETRFHSVKNALAAISSKTGTIGIHDAARPFVSSVVIKNCYRQARKSGNAIPAISLNESIRHVSLKRNKAVDRSDYRIIQTPQCFSLELIQKAFAKKYDARFTDDATVLESIGETINLVEGNFENIKITNPGDMLLAKALLKHEQR
jgi:2-C-methyl-D-erythritol 4-phosphate cytidylyltransferase